MVESPPVVTEDGVALVKAMVKVGPPLFARGPRRGSTAVAPDREPSSTMLLVLVPMVPLPA